MVVCYNSQFLPEEELRLSLSNRAFQYNDGAFETMLFINGKVRFLEDHLTRLQKAADVLKIELPPALLESGTVAHLVEKLILLNKLSGKVRIKLKVWRNGNGLYTPEKNSADVLITAEHQPETSSQLQTADFSRTVQTQFSAYSFFKGPNSIQYVLAGIEKKQKQLDEIILLSSEGFISECLASNIFWIRNGTVFSPKTETGCIAGVMRNNLFRLFQSESILFQEGLFLPEDLLQAETVFSSNVAGIKVIQQIGDRSFSIELPNWLVQNLKENHFI